MTTQQTTALGALQIAKSGFLAELNRLDHGARSAADFDRAESAEVAYETALENAKACGAWVAPMGTQCAT